MNRRPHTASLLVLLVLLLVAAVAGCGGSMSSPPAPSDTAPGPASQGSGPLVGEAQQAAAGDIPDNQVFLTFADAQAGYSMKYPEGWAQRGSGGRVTFQDKNNLVRVTVARGGGVSVAGAAAELGRLKQQTPSLRFETPTQMTVSGKPVVKVVYSTDSAPNSVTGKRVTLVVDRYYVPGAGKHAVVDLGTPQGVDNVDAYRLMIESFRWK